MLNEQSKAKRHWLRQLLWAVPLLALILLLAAIEANSSSFQGCLQNQENGNSAEQFKKNNALLMATASEWIYCTGPFFTANHDAFGAVGTIVIAFFTGTLWWSTSGLLRASNEQGEAIKKSANEATRSATAMEGVATAVSVSAQTGKEIAAQQKLVSEMQLRAYLSVIIGAGTCQDRANNLRFSGSPALLNDSPTPAFKIKSVTKAAILPVPLPTEFVWPALPIESRGEDIIGPRQNRILTVVVDDFVPDNEVVDIKVGRGKALYVWGTITYEDAFENSRQTDFCHLLTWLPNGNVWGIYIPNRNNTT